MEETGPKPISLQTLMARMGNIEERMRDCVHELQHLGSQVLWKMQEEEDADTD